MFDTNAVFIEAASLSDKDKMEGMVSLSVPVQSKTNSGNDVALTIDWIGLSNTNAGFVGILLNAFGDKTISDAKGCRMAAEQNGVVYFQADCSSVESTGFIWGFAFKADDGNWYFIEQNGAVSGNN